MIVYENRKQLFYAESEFASISYCLTRQYKVKWLIIKLGWKLEYYGCEWLKIFLQTAAASMSITFAVGFYELRHKILKSTIIFVYAYVPNIQNTVQSKANTWNVMYVITSNTDYKHNVFHCIVNDS